MKFVILIHSNPQPWGHPTSANTADYQALPQEKRDDLGARWEKVFGDADARAERNVRLQQQQEQSQIQGSRFQPAVPEAVATEARPSRIAANKSPSGTRQSLWSHGL